MVIFMKHMFKSKYFIVVKNKQTQKAHLCDSKKTASKQQFHY